MLKVYYVNKSKQFSKYKWDTKETDLEFRNSLEDFDKKENKTTRPEYHAFPKYPQKELWKQELKSGFTSKFQKDFYRFLKYRSDLSQLCSGILNNIISTPFDIRLLENFEKSPQPRCSWKILKSYTADFHEWLINNSISFNSAYVISRAVGLNSFNNPFKIVKPNGFRIIYEYIDGKTIFTDLDYHIYRESLYTDNQNDIE